MAKLLSEKIPELTIKPEDLRSEFPIYASVQFDCASWSGHDEIDGVKVGVCSWNTMGECLKGFTIVNTGRTDIELHASLS